VTYFTSVIAINNNYLNSKSSVTHLRVILSVSSNINACFRFYSSVNLYENYDDITSETLNILLANQGVSITQAKLDKLKNIPGVKFNLPLNDQTIRALIGLIGRPKTRGLKAGVYIFTHKPTGRKYAGSSNSLSRRLDQYFTFKHLNHDNSGQLLPLIKSEGFDKFSLEVFVLPATPEFSSDYDYLFLEQYYLLHRSFNLNTQRIVNFRVNQGNSIYLYDLKGETLYYSSKSLNQIQGDLGIHPNTCKSCLKGKNYLNFFKITDTPIEGANRVNLSVAELSSLISEKKMLFLSDTSRAKFSRPVIMKNIETGETIEFPSIISIVNHFKLMDQIFDRNKIAKILNTDQPYHGYIFTK
jgi:hypothetical protein